MKTRMKIYPSQIRDIPELLLIRRENQDETRHDVLLPLFRKKLEAVLRKAASKEAAEENKHYIDVCRLLKIDPMVKLGTEKPLKSDKGGTVLEIQKKITKDRETIGYTQDDLTYLKKKNLERLKEFFKRNETGRDGNTIIIDKDSIQSRLSTAVMLELEDAARGEKQSFRTLTPETLRVLHYTQRNFRGNKNLDKFKKLIEPLGLYTCSLSGRLKDSTKDPKLTIAVFNNVAEWDIMRGVAKSTLEDMPRYQKFEPELRTLERLPTEITPNECYVDTRGALANSEEIRYDTHRQIWVIDDNPNKWLCVNARANTGLLQYSSQPTPQPASAILKLGPNLKHQVGFEVEFQEVYSKTSAIKNKDGRPLTPSRVLDDYGWAICPDRSVAGGELKSPVLFFRDSETTEQILEQIPETIKRFINNVAKNDRCGGHLNYSNSHHMPVNCMMAIASWGFIWPLLQDVETRFNDETLKNHDGFHYCQFKRITDPANKYQWIRLKKRCMEIRVFPAHWDCDALVWRSRLIALFMEEVEKYVQNKEDGAVLNTGYSVLTLPGWDQRYVTPMAQTCWNQFQYKNNPVRQHLRTFIANETTTEKMESTSYLNRIKEVLGIKSTIKTTTKSCVA